MRKLPRLSGREVVKVLSRAGFAPARQKGSHLILKKETPGRVQTVVVPLHDEIDRGTLIEIIRQSGMQRKDFLKLV